MNRLLRNGSLHARRDDRGVVALEFVLALPMMVALIVTIITLAGLFQTKSRVVGAARDGARALALKPGVASPSADTNVPDGITVVLDPASAACPALTNPVYQTPTPPQVTAKASKTYTVTVPFVGSWTNDVVERAKMPCG
jgi:Flp pilus assembly protein TadG